MGIIDNAINWAADKIQTMTGEKERRVLVQKCKDLYENFKNMLEESIKIINEKINEFNILIKNLNYYRKYTIGVNIHLLGEFLGKFGNIKNIGEYAQEKESDTLVIPERQLENTESYISEIDWSKTDIFYSSLFFGPIGTKLKTRKQNLSIRERIGLLELEIEGTKNQLKLIEFTVEQDKKIAELYIFCISTISEYIKNVIIPELEVVEAFFQAQTLKNKILADHNLYNICFSNDITLLKDTKYEEHFLFVRNVFMFYIISCKIYNTPILTKLISRNIEESDIDTLETNKDLLLEQKENVNKHIVFDRRTKNDR